MQNSERAEGAVKNTTGIENEQDIPATGSDLSPVGETCTTQKNAMASTAGNVGAEEGKVDAMDGRDGRGRVDAVEAPESPQEGRVVDAGIFAQAAAFGNVLALEGEAAEEDVYLWEHGVAVEPWPEPVDGKTLLEELQRVIERHLVLPRWAAEALALWVVHTYAFQLRQVATYIGIDSPVRRCGKTTLLMLLSELVNRPVVASNITSPAFFHLIEQKTPTLMIDEADTMLHRNPELQGVLNAGYTKRTAYVIRVMTQKSEKGLKGLKGLKGVKGANGVNGGNNGHNGDGLRRGTGAATLARYSCWCPKAIAMIGQLPETLADRCIGVHMQRKGPKDKRERLRNLRGTVELRRKCARFVLDRAAEIRSREPELPDELNDRAADVWEPLLVVADLAGGDWPEKARKAAVGLSGGINEVGPTGSLLSDVVAVFVERGWEAGRDGRDGGNGRLGEASPPGKASLPANGEVSRTGKMFSRELVVELEKMTERPWRALLERNKVTEMWIAEQLRPYGIRPKTMWIGDTAAKGYSAEECAEALQRYEPASGAGEAVEEENPQGEEDFSI